MKYKVELRNYYTLRPDENILVEFKDDKITPILIRTLIVEAKDELEASLIAQKQNKITARNFFMEVETIEPYSETGETTSKTSTETTKADKSYTNQENI